MSNVAAKVLVYLCAGIRLTQKLVDCPCSEMNTTAFLEVRACADNVWCYRCLADSVVGSKVLHLLL